MQVLKFISLSIALHLLVMGILKILPQTTPEWAQNQTEVEILVLPTNMKNPNVLNAEQIVRQTFVPEKIRTQEEQHPARFKSQETVRVKEETQAAINGMTRNGLGESSPQQNAKNQKQAASSSNASEKINKSENQDRDGTLDVAEELKNWQRLQGTSPEPSTIGEALPTDIKVGSFTALNTDRYLFYTFYARVEELVRYRWETRVHNAMDRFPPALAAQFPGRTQWKTQVKFLLDRNGHLRSALILAESGFPHFDLAAIDAFKEARIFPNPPKELVKEDGMVHLDYGFTVYFKPRFISRDL